MTTKILSKLDRMRARVTELERKVEAAGEEHHPGTALLFADLVIARRALEAEEAAMLKAFRGEESP